MGFEMVKMMFMKKAQAVEKVGLEQELVEASLLKLHREMREERGMQRPQLPAALPPSWIQSRDQTSGIANGEDSVAPLTPPQELEHSRYQQAHLPTSAKNGVPPRSV